MRPAIDTPSKTTFAHRRFGEMNARQWACFPIIHHSIHRQHLEEIAKDWGSGQSRFRIFFGGAQGLSDSAAATNGALMA